MPAAVASSMPVAIPNKSYPWLGTVLHSKGLSITVVHTHFSIISQLNHRASLRGLLTRIVEEQDQQQEGLVCVIYDALMYSVEAVAHSLKLPSIILRTSSPKSMGMVPGLHPLRFKDLPVYDFKNEDTLLQLTATVRNTGTSSAVVWNSMDCLEQSSLAQLQQQCQVPNFSIGLMQKMALTSSKELVEIAWGLANSKQRILWVLRPGSVHRSNSAALLYDDFKETVGARGCIVRSFPSNIILAIVTVHRIVRTCVSSDLDHQVKSFKAVLDPSELRLHMSVTEVIRCSTQSKPPKETEMEKQGLRCLWLALSRPHNTDATARRHPSFQGALNHSSKSMKLVPILHPLRFKDLPVFDSENEDTILHS
ncbi:hypothetical protein JRO89_XS13G0110100 [Xanthoceras sorbifolium]|uniref:Uncharacterized protein n=1 Tax=Xanthoceras sorbifolium TaxID=99658 RepID=A0ABQ8H7Q8_9ROSI|nr:hypothetical protein JRO89_XS13G0110100 [Xanthoceras sorbifolium]